MELINYGQISHDTFVLNNNGLLKIMNNAMNTITAAIGSMSLYLAYGKHRAFELFLVLRSHYKMTTETGEDG